MAKPPTFSAEFKAKVALVAISSHKTPQEIARIFEIRPSQVLEWKQQILEGAPQLLANRQSPPVSREQQALLKELYRQIAQLKVEVELLKRSKTVLPTSNWC
ncbi:MAG: transposase [Sumerlaeia bacterium]